MKGQSQLADLNGFSELRVALRRFSHLAPLDFQNAYIQDLIIHFIFSGINLRFPLQLAACGILITDKRLKYSQNMTNHIAPIFSASPIGRIAFVAMATLSFVFCERASAQDVNNGDFKIDPGLALTNPDEFNWSLLVAVSKKAPPNLQFPAGPNTTNNAVWETWADDQFTFPRQPDPANPPKWQDRNKPLRPQSITQLQLRLRLFRHERAGLQPEAIIPGGGGEVVFRNQSSFDFIIKHDLFYQEGLAAA